MATTRPGGVLPLMAAASLLLLLGRPAAAGWDGFGGYGQAFSGRIGPYDANSTEFESAVAASNATAVFQIPGYDVSKPFPGEPMAGWTVSLAALDLSHSLRVYCTNGDCQGDGMVGHSMAIRAPDALLRPDEGGRSVVVDAHPSWGMCIWDYGSPSFRRPERYNNQDNRALNPDGSCAGFLSDACIAALERATRDAYSVAPSAAEARTSFPGQLTTCGRLRLPDDAYVSDVCGEHGPGNAGGAAIPSYGGVPVPFLNGSATSTDGWEFDGDERYGGPEDLRAFWDSLVLNYWVVVTAMVNATADANATAADRGDPLARVHCIAPNGAGTGKGFTFSGIVPANTRNFESEGAAGAGGGGAAGGDSDENGAGLAASPVKGGIWAVLVALAVVSFC